MTADEDNDVQGKKEERVCRALCANEAKLSCPNGDEERCVTGCQLAEACNSLANEGPTVSVTMVAEDPPTADATGGEVLPGTYRLTSALVHTGPEGSSGPTGRLQRQTLLVSIDAPGTLRVESALSLQGGADRRTSMTTTLSGSTAIATQTCPENVSLVGFYTATATSYVTYDSTGYVGTYELDSSD